MPTILYFVFLFLGVLSNHLILSAKQHPGFCSLYQDPGPCKAFTRRFYFDKRVRHCVGFFYGGCEGNENNFKTEKECEFVCKLPVCSQPKNLGYGMKVDVRYYYDESQDLCEKFNYGGSGGNENNFRSIEKCEAICAGQHKRAEKEE